MRFLFDRLETFLDWLRESTLHKVYLTVGGGIVVFLCFTVFRGERIPEPDEFFRRNSHLTRYPTPEKRPVEPPRLRDEFEKGDYYLLAGHSYPVQAGYVNDFDTADKKSSKKIQYDSKLILHSLGFKDRKLYLVAEYFLKPISGFLKFSPNFSNETNALPTAAPAGIRHTMLLSIDSAGALLAAWLPQKQAEDSVQAKVFLADSLFKKIPHTEVGSFTQKRFDKSGVQYPFQYRITQGSDSRLLQVNGSAEYTNSLGGSTAKAAAAGAPGLGKLGLMILTQNHSIDWLWDKELQIPRSQKSESRMVFLYDSNPVVRSIGKSVSEWSMPGEGKFTLKDLNRFPIPVNLGAFLNSRLDEINGKKSRKLLSTLPPRKRAERMLKANSGGVSEKEQEEIFQDVVDALKDDPSLVSDYERVATTSPPGSRSTSMIIGALGALGTPEAQEAMIQIFQESAASPEEKQKIMMEFAVAPQPLTESTKGFLKDYYEKSDPTIDSLATSAGLALGTSIAFDGDPKTIRYVKEKWEKATPGLFSKETSHTTVQQEHLLGVMGNSKSDAFINEVEESAKSDNVTLRSAAITATRFSQDEKGRSILHDGLFKDSDTEVRLSAANAMYYQPADARSFSDLQSCAASDSFVGVKIECYKVLGTRLAEPGVKEFLSSHLGSEKDPQVRAAIQSSLNVTE
jgi:hypothetical protein